MIAPTALLLTTLALSAGFAGRAPATAVPIVLQEPQQPRPPRQDPQKDRPRPDARENHPRQEPRAEPQRARPADHPQPRSTGEPELRRRKP